MELIIETDGLFHLIKLTEQMMEHIKLLNQVDCFELCDIIRLEFTTYLEAPFNKHVINNGTGNLYGCICK
jgi:hypothetical protein